MWHTTEHWDKVCELLNLESQITESHRDNEEIEEMKLRIEELENEGISSFYAEDDSNACDWDNADSVEEVDE